MIYSSSNPLFRDKCDQYLQLQISVHTNYNYQHKMKITFSRTMDSEFIEMANAGEVARLQIEPCTISLYNLTLRYL